MTHYFQMTYRTKQKYMHILGCIINLMFVYIIFSDTISIL